MSDKQERPRAPRVIAIANQKGGVGKTTTAINLGTALAAIKQKVAIIDLDPQGNASTGLGVPPSQRQMTSYDVLVEGDPLTSALVPTVVPGLSIVPSDVLLSGAELELADDQRRSYRLKRAVDQSIRALAEKDDHLDYILIDCPPSLNVLTVNALTAADAILVPLQCEFFALEGLTQLIKTVERVRGHLNTHLDIQGVVLTMYDSRNNLSAEVAADVRAHFGDKVYKTMTESELDALADSIADKGIVQPILVRPLTGDDAQYEIVAGERRWRAAQRARLHEVPALIRELTDRETLEIGIVENVQRSDLNPVEEAQAYKQLIDRFGHTQDDVAQAVSKSRSHVANMVRLLALPAGVLEFLADGRISAGHARAIATAPDPVKLAEEIVARGLSVREAERLARAAQTGEAPEKKAAQKADKDADTRALEADIASRLGLNVDIRHGAKGGEIRVQYTTLEQLDDVCRRLSGNATAG